MQKNESLLTVKEAAAALKISTRHLNNLRIKGVIPVVRLGDCVRIRPVDLERMTEKLLVGGDEK